MRDLICPKCKGEKWPFDVHCEDCYEFSVVVKKGRKFAMEVIVTELGYKCRGLLEKNRYSINGHLDQYLLIIEAPRRDEATIKSLLRET